MAPSDHCDSGSSSVLAVGRGASCAALFAAGLAALSALGGCSSNPQAEWPPVQKQWYDRAQVSFKALDFDDAESSIDNALRLDKGREEVRVLAAQIALANLDYAGAIQQLAGLSSSEARSIRGRALWYSGKVEEAADELQQLLADPEVRDPWADQVSKIARQGTGRRPFRLTGGLLAVSEMPHAGNSAMLVPLELDGEPVLGLISTGTAEVTVDSSGGRSASWVALRFGERLEVKDVPALTQDLSGISRELGAPIKVLLGVSLLRHLNVTFDFFGSQFVARSFVPPPPPAATTVKLHYVRGGGMVLRGRFGREERAPAAAMIIDTSMQFPLLLDDGGWQKAGVDKKSLMLVEGSKDLRHGVVPTLQLGAFEIPQIPGVHGKELSRFESGLGVDLDGVLGSRLLAAFRVTLTDGGRTMWLEDAPAPLPEPGTRSGAEPAAPAAAPAPAAGG
jgi:hypothetical protein